MKNRSVKTGNRTSVTDPVSLQSTMGLGASEEVRCCVRCTEIRHGEALHDAYWQSLVGAWPELPAPARAAAAGLVNAYQAASRL